MKVPYLDVEAKTQYIDVDDNPTIIELLQVMGFDVIKGYLKWDYTYMMSEDNRVFNEGKRQEQMLESMLNITFQINLMTQEEIRTMNYLLPENAKEKAQVIELVATYESGAINLDELSARLAAMLHNRRKSDMLIDTLES